MNDAIYVVEFRSISHGIGVLDRMLKRADVELAYANPICIGKYLVCICGDVDDVAEAKAAAEEPDVAAPLAGYLLTGAHPAIRAYFSRGAPRESAAPAAIGIFETKGAAGGFQSLDAALKSARVRLFKLWLGQLLGGKFCYVLGGGVSDVESAVRAAEKAIPEQEQVGSRVVLSPSPQTMERFLSGRNNR